jgi:uncharacterized protein YcnI
MNSFTLYRSFAAALLLLAGLSGAQAHVSLEWQAATAGSTYKAVFGIGHGCGNSPTRQVIVEIPAGVRNARPMPKPGWAVTQDLARITWTARSADDMLPPTQYDEFTLVGGLPGEAGALYWPIRQVCVEGRHDWVEVPQPGKAGRLASPAPMLDILPAGGAAGHAH